MTVNVMARNDAEAEVLQSGRSTIELEIKGLRELSDLLAVHLAGPFVKAVDLMRKAQGRIIVSGIGKSGHIARKVAATLASTGTPAFFIHPSEASHGDLGVIGSNDIILLLSWSGETPELADLIAYSARFKIALIAITSSRESALGRAADVVLELPRSAEACPFGLAPTTSSTLQLVMGDALAIALIEARGFTANDFHLFHPGGKLGARLRTIGSLMHTGDELPIVRLGTIMSEALLAIAGKRFGCAGVVDPLDHLVGMITDGDLRRHMSEDLLSLRVDEVMTRDPTTLDAGVLASTALETMNRKRITAIFIVKDGRVEGILHIHDLLRAGVV